MLLRSPRTVERTEGRAVRGRPRGCVLGGGKGWGGGVAVSSEGHGGGSRSLIRVLKLVDRTSLSFVDASRRGSSPLSDIFVLSRGNIIRDYLWGVKTSSSHNVHKLQAICGLFLLFCSAAKSSLRPARRAPIPSKPRPIVSLRRLRIPSEIHTVSMRSHPSHPRMGGGSTGAPVLGCSSDRGGRSEPITAWGVYQGV